LKLNKNSDVVIYANLLKLKGGIIFSGENDNNIFINGFFFFIKNIIHKKGKLKINKNYTLYCENLEIIIKELIIQIHPFINNIDFNETIIQKLTTNFSDYLFNNIFNFKFLKSMNNLFNLNEKIIISLTSWKKRINKAHKPIEILLNNSFKPDKVILNLAIEEFPEKNLELPNSILKLLKFKNFEIYWVTKNNNVFKKLIPTINRYKNDLIITIDDDYIYPFDLIENILKNYIKFGSNRPLSFGNNKTDWIINNIRISSHFGPCSIVKYQFFNEKLNEIYKETTEKLIEKNIKCCYDDLLYTYAAILNEFQYMRIKNYSIQKYINKNLSDNGFSENYSKKLVKKMFEYHFLIRNYIKKKYNIEIKNLIHKNNKIKNFNYINNFFNLIFK
jgi:hypothetical protein